MSLPEHIIRPGHLGDRGYVISTWLQTYRASQFASKLPDWAYWSRFGHVGLVEATLDDPDTRVKVACLPEGGPWMYGWIAYTHVPQLTVHYVFVRYEYQQNQGRGQPGFGRRLLDDVSPPELGRLLVTHITPEFSKRLTHGREVIFRNPYRKAA